MRILHRLLGIFGRGVDQPLEEQVQDWMRHPYWPQFSTQLGPDCDVLPDAKGEFGTSLTNPIPVNGPIGETIYINTLRGKTRVGFFNYRVRSLSSPACNTPVDMFELVAIDASQSATLYFSMYHRRRSVKVPVGFTRRSWSSLEDIEKVFSRLDAFGTCSHHLENFPFDLPHVIEKSEQLAHISPGLGNRMADTIRRLLSEHPDRWRDYIQSRPTPRPSLGLS